MEGPAHDTQAIKSLGSQVLANARLDSHVVQCERIVNAELDREYDAYVIVNEDGGEFVLKYSEDGSEARIYEEVFAGRNLPVPDYYGKVTDPELGGWYEANLGAMKSLARSLGY